jgi:exodeoxyribonuclease VII small subunit
MSKKPTDFETALKELEGIVAQLEDGDLPLERALELFERGVTLSRECQKRLEEAERKVEILLKNARGEYEPHPFEEPPAEEADGL